MYSVTGVMALAQGDVYGVDLLTSKGQNGGALTDSETGHVYAIYTGIGKHPAHADAPLGLCVALTNDCQKWVGSLE